MALTTPEKITLFSILECPYTGSVDQPIDEFNLTGRRTEPANDDQKIQIAITNRLAALSTDEETWLKQRLDTWQLIGSNAALIEAGATGGTSGITYDPNSQRYIIQREVRILINVIEMKSQIQVGKEGQHGAFVSMGIR